MIRTVFFATSRVLLMWWQRWWRWWWWWGWWWWWWWWWRWWWWRWWRWWWWWWWWPLQGGCVAPPQWPRRAALEPFALLASGDPIPSLFFFSATMMMTSFSCKMPWWWWRVREASTEGNAKWSPRWLECSESGKSSNWKCIQPNQQHSIDGDGEEDWWRWLQRWLIAMMLMM